jgi:predicted nucleic acid-binding protein
MRRFFDSNMLIYAVSDDPRRATADRVLRDGGVISAQVLNEFANVARKTLRRKWQDVERSVLRFRQAVEEIVPLTVELNAVAISLARDHRFSFYDALVVAAALEAGCDVLLTEDMQNGRVIDRLTIRNPFLEGRP